MYIIVIPLWLSTELQRFPSTSRTAISRPWSSILYNLFRLVRSKKNEPSKIKIKKQFIGVPTCLNAFKTCARCTNLWSFCCSQLEMMLRVPILDFDQVNAVARPSNCVDSRYALFWSVHCTSRIAVQSFLYRVLTPSFDVGAFPNFYSSLIGIRNSELQTFHFSAEIRRVSRIILLLITKENRLSGNE
jgi:hypothetical protein